ncbi:MAG: CHAT domain-containing protein [Paludibacteraceae bacterium]|nr:CHAT domain-containing protein [Paludibacteraceae bacterium]MBO5828269.1 CHAT domain-containing protein [Paludibacteraceae bacterium]
MKRILFIILFIAESLCFYAIGNNELFVQAIKQKDYSSSLELADNAASCLRFLGNNQISWDEYVNLMSYADEINHPYRDSLIINGVIFLGNCAIKYTEIQSYEMAISLLETALSLSNFVFTQDNILQAGLHKQLAVNNGQLAKYNEAIKHSTIAYEIAGKCTNDTVILTSMLNDLGFFYWQTTDYEVANKFLQQAEDLSLSLPSNHKERIKTVYYIANSFSEMGLLDAAYKKIDNCISSIGPTDYAYLPPLLSSLAKICVDLGKYDLAVEYGEKGLSILSEYGTMSLQKEKDESSLLNHLSTAYFYLYNTEKAIEYAERAFSIYTPTDSNEYAIFLNNLGALYSNSNVQKSLECYNKAISLISPSNNNYLLLLSNIGNLYFKIKNYKEAQIYYERALESISNISIVNNTHIATLYLHISDILEKMGKNKLSLQWCEDAFEICKFGDVSNDFIALLKSNRAFKYSFIKGKELHAYDLWHDVLQTYTNLTANHFDYLTEEERSMYWQKSQTMHDFIPSFVYEYYKKHPQFTSLAYNNALLTKGMLLQSTNHVRKSIEQSGDTLLQQQWEELLKTQQVLTSSALPNTTKDSLTNRAELLEAWIMKNSREFRQSKEIWEKDWTDVKNVLKDGEVAIEFIDFYSIIKHDKTEHIYAALLVRPNDKRPIFVPLCAEDEIHSQLGNPTQTYDINGSELYELIWSQITPYLAENNTIYFAPSGLLHQLNIELLPMQDLRLISDVYNLVRVSSTRELLLEHGNTSFTSATLYGGLIYDMDTTDMIANSSIYDDIQYRSFSLSDTLSRKGVAYLPGTKKEIENIFLCLQSTGSEIRMFTGAQGNEESFKAQTGGNNNILHIATHGFFFEDEEVNITDLFKPQMQQIGQREQVLDPLLRSGLLLAGSNYAFTGHFEQLPKSLQDGVLYAKEISLLDLSETELVVLSACETGQGDITSEGVFGLQRAFKMAGVQTIIMSLWKVNDQATQLLMTEFYNNWIGKHQSKREAFRNAQNTVRTQYEEPEYWAGFIMLD